MLTNIKKFFDTYTTVDAPFMHAQFAQLVHDRPFNKMKVIHHFPLVTNTLLKIACLVAAGADVTVTNPNFLKAHRSALDALQADNINYCDDLNKLQGMHFDIFFDCGAEIYQTLGNPNLGAVELTATGDNFYRSAHVNFPVLSIDKTYTKQLETVFGCASNVAASVKKIIDVDITNKKWLLVGFGKIGRGLGFYCKHNGIEVIASDIDVAARATAEGLGISSVDPNNLEMFKDALQQIDVVITATGIANVMSVYPKQWFANKILVNMGIADEFGPAFNINEIVNNKLPVNFVLHDPTPMKYIDPTFYAHNEAGLELLKEQWQGIRSLSTEIDNSIIERWCQFHNEDRSLIEKWFSER